MVLLILLIFLLFLDLNHNFLSAYLYKLFFNFLFIKINILEIYKNSISIVIFNQLNFILNAKNPASSLTRGRELYSRGTTSFY